MVDKPLYRLFSRRGYGTIRGERGLSVVVHLFYFWYVNPKFGPQGVSRKMRNLQLFRELLLLDTIETIERKCN